MACIAQENIFDLAARESLHLADIAGATLRVTAGALWITQENDTRDHVLQAGDRWVADRNGLTIVEAQRPTTFCMQAAPASRAPRGLAGLRAYVTALRSTPARRSAPYY